MATEEQKKLVIALKPMMKEAGFNKKRYTWHRSMDNLVHVFNVQGSQWGKSIYINLGVYFIGIGNTETPAQNHCHIQQRLARIANDPNRCNELFDFSSKIVDIQRHIEISQVIENSAFPWLDRFSTVDGARNTIEQGKNPSTAVTIAAKKYLGIAEE